VYAGIESARKPKSATTCGHVFTREKVLDAAAHRVMEMIFRDKLGNVVHSCPWIQRRYLLCRDYLDLSLGQGLWKWVGLDRGEWSNLGILCILLLLRILLLLLLLLILLLLRLFSVHNTGVLSVLLIHLRLRLGLGLGLVVHL